MIRTHAATRRTRLVWPSCVLPLIYSCPLLLSAAAQPVPHADLSSIHRLHCVFLVRSAGEWLQAEPRARVSTEGRLTLEIDGIDSQAGSARVSGAGASAVEVVARLSDKSLHFLETDVTGSLAVTTVFGGTDDRGKLKAVHSRVSFVPIDLPGFTAEPMLSQYYGDCTVAR